MFANGVPVGIGVLVGVLGTTSVFVAVTAGVMLVVLVGVGVWVAVSMLLGVHVACRIAKVSLAIAVFSP